LLELFGVDCYEQYQQLHQSWIAAALEAEDNQRVAVWSQNIARII
jgi:hypothetical protein